MRGEIQKRGSKACLSVSECGHFEAPVLMRAVYRCMREGALPPNSGLQNWSYGCFPAGPKGYKERQSKDRDFQKSRSLMRCDWQIQVRRSSICVACSLNCSLYELRLGRRPSMPCDRKWFTQVRIFSSGTDHCRASNFARPSPARKLLTTSSLNFVCYFFMNPLGVCPTPGGQFMFRGRDIAQRSVQHKDGIAGCIPPIAAWRPWGGTWPGTSSKRWRKARSSQRSGWPRRDALAEPTPMPGAASTSPAGKEVQIMPVGLICDGL